MPRLLLVPFLLSLAACTPTADLPEPRTDTDLAAALEALVQDFRGDVGIYVRHFPTGREVAIRADTLFPTASLVKVPILATLFDQIEQGRFGYHDTWVYRDSLFYPGDDLLGSFADGQEVALSKLVLLMEALSDNTASLWLQKQVGTGAAVNDWLAANGFADTRVNSRTPGREEAFGRFGWGQTTPREMARLLSMIRFGEAVNPAASEEMYRVLSGTYWNDEALARIPPGVQAASKQGAVSASRSEVVFVNAPSGDYVFCVITKNQTDQRWEHDNEGFVLLRDVSELLWKTFEPDSDWQPAPGMERYWE